MTTAIAIVLALVAAVALALGALLQHRGVVDEHATAGSLNLKATLRLFREPVWLGGLVAMGAGVVCNVIALAMAPVMVVQPIGAVSLVVSVLLGIRYRGLKINKRIGVSVIVCTAGVAGFVALSTIIARTGVHQGPSAFVLAGLGVGVSLIFLIIALFYRHPPQLLLVLGAGLQFGCVATNVHLVAVQFLADGITGIGWANVVALLLGSAVGSWFVQAAYAAGPPEIVIAGLTVVDPIFAVLLGAIVLGEASHAPVWLATIMTVTGLVACAAVAILSRYHPDAVERERVRKHAKAQGSTDI